MWPQPGLAIFQGAPGTVMVDDSAGAISVSGMHFAVDGYTLTGSALNLIDRRGDVPIVEVGDGDTGGAGYEAVINNVLTGTDGLVKNGAGTLVLTGNNTYTGGTTINAGTLQLGSWTRSGSIVGSVVNNGSLVFDRVDAVIYAGLISGAGSLTQRGAGTLTLTSSNTYTGGTTIGEDSALALVGSGSIANSASLVMDLDSKLDISGATNGTMVRDLQGGGSIALGGKDLTVSNDADLMYWGVIGGSGGLILASGGLELLSANTYTGLTTIDPGAVLQLGNVGPGSVEGDILDNGALTFYFDHAHLTYGGVISGTGAVSKVGTGTLTLTGANTFTGGVLVSGDRDNGGKVAVSSDVNLGSPSGEVNLEGGWLEATASFTLTHPIYLYDTASTVQVDAGATLTVANPITGDEYPYYDTYDVLLKVGTGTLVLAGDNTYGGHTSILGGTLALAGSGSLAASSGLTDYTTFDISGTTDGAIIQSLLGDGAITLGAETLTLNNNSNFGGVISGSGGLTVSGGTTTLSGTNTYTGLTTINTGAALQVGNRFSGLAGSIVSDVVDNGSLTFDRYADVTYAGTISGTGSVTQAGTGVLTLTGTNTYSGGTTINSGSTLALAGAGSVGASNGVRVDGTFDISGMATPGIPAIHGLSGAGSVVLGGQTLQLLNASGDFSGVISGSGGLILSGTSGGTETLSGTNTYSGETTILNGTLALVGNGSIAESARLAVHGGGTLDISGTSSGATIKSFSGGLSGGAAIVLGEKNLTISGGGEIAGVISGTGGLVVSGGTLALSGASTYTGATTIDGGATLQLGDGSSNGSIVSDVMDNGILMFYPGVDSSMSYGGAISGAGAVALNGGGKLSLTGTNTFGGGVTVEGGTLSISEDANLGAAGTTLVLVGGSTQVGSTLETTGSFSTGRNVALQSGGVIQTDGGSNFSVAGEISGDGILTKQGAGTLVLAGTSTWSGGLQVEGGTLAVDGSITLASDPFVVSDVSIYGGVLTGTGAVHADVSNFAKLAVHGGDLTVDGNYTSNDAGTLAVSLGSKLAVTGTATLNGGTLEVTGADSGYVANTHTQVVTAAGGVTGTFDNLVKDTGVVFTSTTIGYGANEVYLDTTGLNITVAAAAMGIVDPASASAARRVQTGFEAIDATMASGGTPSPDVLQGAGAIQHSATPAVAQATLQSLSGQLHAASAAMLFSGIDAGHHALSGHFDDLASGRSKSGVWYSTLGWEGDLQRSGYAGASFRSGGGMAGADLRIGTRGWLGVAAGQSSGYGQLDEAWDHDRTWMNSLALYGGVVNGSWYASAQLATGWYREDMQRLLQLGALMAPVGNASTGRYMAGALEGGRLFHIGGTRIVPFADVRYQSLDLGGFTEQGGLGYGLKAEARTVGRWQTGVGIRAERGWQLANGMQMAFDGSAGWQHTLRQRGDVFNASFTGFNDWLPVEGIGLSRNTTTWRAGVSLWPTSNFGLRLGYMRQQDRQERAGSAMLQGTVTF